MADTPNETPLYNLLRERAMKAYEQKVISYATLDNCLKLATIIEADMTMRNIAHIALNITPSGDLQQ